MMKKKRLTENQEFEIMKLVLDKFLWLGFAVMAWGLYKLFTFGWDAVQDAVLLFIGGAVILVVFMILIVREYEIIK
jgi:hypothetical protein